MENLGNVSGFVVKWDSDTGEVWVGDERATDASGQNAYAYSKDRALEVARDYIRHAQGGS